MLRPEILLPQGKIIGIKENTKYPQPISLYLGIPYALPPVGPLRFKRPVPISPSPSSTLDASNWTPRCPQKSFLVGAPAEPESEDCLYLNVFVPQNLSPEKKVPVGVYIHGGAFNRGSCKLHDSASMVGWAEEGMIIVSFNYRIGALGFLPCEVAKNEGVLNLGLWDQKCVLDWVQENIGRFGGDKNAVTIFGLSAGAHSVAHHMMNVTETRPLFHRAIIESGAATSRACHSYNAPVHEEQFKQFIELCGVPSSLPKSEILDYLRNLPCTTISKASISTFDAYNPSLRWAFQPCVDGEIISRRPIDAWKSGDWHKIPVLTGFVTNEGSMYVAKQMDSPQQFTSFIKSLLPKLTESDISAVEALFPDPNGDSKAVYFEDRKGVGSQYKRVERAYATYAYSSPVRHTAHFISSDNLTKKTEEKTPVYLFHWANICTVLNGANHGDYMWYEFHDDKVAAISEAQKELVGVTHAYWTSFVIHGDPNVLKGRWRDRPVWRPYRQGEKCKMVFGEGNDERAGGSGAGVAAQMRGDEWMKEEAEFWWSKTPSE